MVMNAERALRVGGIDLLLRCDNADAVDALLAGWQGYRPAAAPPAPHVVVEYTAVEGYLTEQPAQRAYPGFACVARSPHEYELARRDSRGTIEIPSDLSRPVVARFEGNARPFAIEASLRLGMSLAVPRLGGLMLHSAGVSTGASALLFTGPSSAGKSTIAGLLADRFPRRLGDDLTIARPDPAAPGHWRAYATPFAGELGPAPDGEAPLAALYFLIKSSRHRAEPLSTHEVLRRLLRNVMAYVQERGAAERVLAAAARFASEIPCYVLEFAKDPGVARVLGVT
jgi:hypothetical protein